MKGVLRSYSRCWSLNSNFAEEGKLFQFLSYPWSSEKHFLSQECFISALEPDTSLLILSGPINPVLLSAQQYNLSRWTWDMVPLQPVAAQEAMSTVSYSNHHRLEYRNMDKYSYEVDVSIFPDSNLPISLSLVWVSGSQVYLSVLFLHHSYYLGICRCQFICQVPLPASIKTRKWAFFFLIWELLSYSNCKIHGITWVDLFFSVLVTEQALSTHKISPKLYQAQYPMSNRSLQPVFKKYGQEIGYLNCSFLAEPTQLLVILFLLYCLDPQLKGKNSHSIASINEREKMILQGSKVLTPLQLSQNDLCTPLHLSQKMCWKLHSGLLCYGVGQEDSQL